MRITNFLDQKQCGKRAIAQACDADSATLLGRMNVTLIVHRWYEEAGDDEVTQ